MRFLFTREQLFFSIISHLVWPATEWLIVDQVEKIERRKNLWLSSWIYYNNERITICHTLLIHRFYVPVQCISPGGLLITTAILAFTFNVNEFQKLRLSNFDNTYVADLYPCLFFSRLFRCCCCCWSNHKKFTTLLLIDCEFDQI